MGMFSFRRAKEREAALEAASIPPPKPKRKRKPKVKPDGDHDSRDSRSGERKQLSDSERNK